MQPTAETLKHGPDGSTDPPEFLNRTSSEIQVAIELTSDNKLFCWPGGV